jgi:hypothetical protein
MGWATVSKHFFFLKERGGQQVGPDRPARECSGIMGKGKGDSDAALGLSDYMDPPNEMIILILID